jgi:CubicO group peptidase (beta-lactamase class C family)
MQTIITKLLILSAPMFLLNSGPASEADPAPSAQPATAKVETFLRSEMQKRRIPGLQVAIVRHGKIVFNEAYGLANIQDSVPVTNQTVFTINSATKSFTGVAVMQLVDDGKLDVAAPVSRYLENLPATWQTVTIRQLLSHTSGLPAIMDDNAKMVADEGDEAAWAKVQTLPVEFAPGERFSYNQTNYLLLGRIIDKLSDKPFTQFIAERQFRVVGMPLTAQSGLGDSHDVIPGSARVYTFSRTGNISNVFEEFPMFLRTAAGINSTAEEMARWIIALQEGKLLKRQTNLTTLWTPVLLNDGSQGGFGGLLNGYALGFPTVTRSKHRAVAGVGGGRSAFFIYPDDALAVVILTNLQGASPESFIDELASHYIPTINAAKGQAMIGAVPAPIWAPLRYEIKQIDACPRWLLCSMEIQ